MDLNEIKDSLFKEYQGEMIHFVNARLRGGLCVTEGFLLANDFIVSQYDEKYDKPEYAVKISNDDSDSMILCKIDGSYVTCWADKDGVENQFTKLRTEVYITKDTLLEVCKPEDMKKVLVGRMACLMKDVMIANERMKLGMNPVQDSGYTETITEL